MRTTANRKCLIDMNKKIGIIIILLIFISLSCGVYTFDPKGKSDISAVAVERFTNNTPEFGLADRMTDDVIDALMADGNLKVVSAENADVILTGALVSYERKPYQFTETDEVISYSVIMDFDIVLREADSDSEIWKERMRQTGIYEVETETEDDGQQKAIGFLVEAIINKTTKSW